MCASRRRLRKTESPSWIGVPSPSDTKTVYFRGRQHCFKLNFKALMQAVITTGRRSTQFARIVFRSLPQRSVTIQKKVLQSATLVELSIHEMMANKKPGPKGGDKPPIFQIEPSRRLFVAEHTGDGVLRHRVQCLSLYRFVLVPDPVETAKALENALLKSALIDFAGTVFLMRTQIAQDSFSPRIIV